MKKKKRVAEYIEKKEWVRHFKGLLGADMQDEHVEAEEG